MLWETVFNWPGIGKLCFEAINSKKIVLAADIILVMMLCVLLAKTVSEILRVIIDPRLRMNKGLYLKGDND